MAFTIEDARVVDYEGELEAQGYIRHRDWAAHRVGPW
jgi:hypothetical protein